MRTASRNGCAPSSASADRLSFGREHARKSRTGTCLPVLAILLAGAGYVVGQAVARTTGRSHVANEAGRGAAVVGAAGGAGAGAKNRRGIIKNCMIGRGHAVLD